MNIYGFVGKPDTVRKTRGDQYFFCQQPVYPKRLSESCGDECFDEMISKDSFPLYALFIDLDPSCRLILIASYKAGNKI